MRYGHFWAAGTGPLPSEGGWEMIKKGLFAASFGPIALCAWPAQATTEVPLWYALTGYLGEQVQSVCDRFNASQDEYEVVCVGRGGYEEALQSAIAAYRAGEQPAMVQVADAGNLTMMLSGAIYPVHELMADQGIAVDWDAFIDPVLMNFASSQGDLYSFPFNISTAVLYYNVEQFEAAGLDGPPETWTEFVEAMRALQASGVDCPYADSPHAWTHLTQLNAVHNEPVATHDNGFAGLDARYVYDQGVQARHVQMLKDMYDEGLLHIYGPLMGTSTGISAREAFASGRCAVNTSSIAGHATVNRLVDGQFDWSVAMMPVHDGYERHNTFAGGAALWVFDGHDDAVYAGTARFLEFLASADSQRHWSTVTGYIPLTTDAFDSLVAEGFYREPEFAGRDVAIASLQAGGGTTPNTRGVRLGYVTQAQAIWREEIDRILVDQNDVETGLANAVRRSNDLLEQFQTLHEGTEVP